METGFCLGLLVQLSVDALRSTARSYFEVYCSIYCLESFFFFFFFFFRLGLLILLSVDTLKSTARFILWCFICCLGSVFCLWLLIILSVHTLKSTSRFILWSLMFTSYFEVYCFIYCRGSAFLLGTVNPASLLMLWSLLLASYFEICCSIFCLESAFLLRLQSLLLSWDVYCLFHTLKSCNTFKSAVPSIVQSLLFFWYFEVYFSLDAMKPASHLVLVKSTIDSWPGQRMLRLLDLVPLRSQGSTNNRGGSSEAERYASLEVHCSFNALKSTLLSLLWTLLFLLHLDV